MSCDDRRVSILERLRVDKPNVQAGMGGGTDDGPAGMVRAGPLYAGETVTRIDRVLPAAGIVAALTP